VCSETYNLSGRGFSNTVPANGSLQDPRLTGSKHAAKPKQTYSISQEDWAERYYSRVGRQQAKRFDEYHTERSDLGIATSKECDESIYFLQNTPRLTLRVIPVPDRSVSRYRLPETEEKGERSLERLTSVLVSEERNMGSY
jgi:hypothetical protein